MTNSKRKGKAGELEAAAELRRVLGADVRRSQQYCGAAGDSDLIGLEGVHVEVKRCKRLSLYPAMQQAVDEARDGSVPIVLHRADGTNQHDRRSWLVVVRLDDLPSLAGRLQMLHEQTGLPK